MGSCLSGDATAGAFSGVQQQELLLKFADLRTSMHLNETEFIRMYKYFAEANLNDDGCIQLDEFLVFFGQSKSRFTVRVYDMFRDDNEEGITFKQWVFALWNFCTTDSDALILFGFQLYDKGGKGLLDLKDIEHMMVELFGNDYEANGLAKDLLKSLLDTDYKGNPTTSGVTAARFAKVCARAKNILYPAFKLQHQVRTSCGFGSTSLL
jgi:Ca2+-binding EF-hand superfamily protein